MGKRAECDEGDPAPCKALLPRRVLVTAGGHGLPLHGAGTVLWRERGVYAQQGLGVLPGVCP